MTGTVSADNPLGYMGINSQQQPKFVSLQRAPTNNDYLNFEVGTNWNDISQDPPNLYILKSVQGNQAIWQLVPDGGSSLNTLTGDTGTATPAAANIKIAGGTNVTTSASSDTVTITATDTSGATSFPTDSGTATESAGVLNISGGTGINTSATGNTVTVNQDSPVTVANGGTGASTLTDGGVLLGSGVSTVTQTAQPTNGQLLIGSTGSDPVLGTLTAGTDISIVEAAGSVTINSTASGLVQSGLTAFTPELRFGGANVGMVYSIQSGYYIKTGNMVHVDIAIRITSAGSSVGTALFENLPFPISNSSNYFPMFTGEFGGVTAAATFSFMMGRGILGTTTINLLVSGVGIGTASASIGNGNFLPPTQIILSGDYHTP